MSVLLKPAQTEVYATNTASDHANLDRHGLFWLNACVLLIYQSHSELSLGGIASLPHICFHNSLSRFRKLSNKETFHEHCN
jgi:hypothetical protein